MYPVIFSIGPFSLSTFNLFLVLGFLVMAFIFWRQTKEEHYPEYELFDKFLLAVLVGMLAGRLSYIFLHFTEFGFNLAKWFNLFAFGGFIGLVAVWVATLHLAIAVKQKKWDVFEILDYWVTSLALGAVFVYLGLFFDGPGNGLATSLPWGVTFPGQDQPHHPVALYWALFYLSLFLFLSWVEYRYRTFAWYKAGKKAAQTGFLTASALILIGLFSFGLSFITLDQLVIRSWSLDSGLALVTLFLGIGLMAVRSGRFQFRKTRHPRYAKPQSKTTS